MGAGLIVKLYHVHLQALRSASEGWLIRYVDEVQLPKLRNVVARMMLARPVKPVDLQILAAIGVLRLLMVNLEISMMLGLLERLPHALARLVGMETMMLLEQELVGAQEALPVLEKSTP